MFSLNYFESLYAVYSLHLNRNLPPVAVIDKEIIVSIDLLVSASCFQTDQLRRISDERD